MENDPYEVAVPRPLPSPLEFLKAVYSNEGLPLQARLKAAIEAAQYVHPKLAVTANIQAGDFADQLDRAVERTRRVLMIEQPIIEANAADVSSDTTRPQTSNGDGHKPLVPDRRYRRW